MIGLQIPFAYRRLATFDLPPLQGGRFWYWAPGVKTPG